MPDEQQGLAAYACRPPEQRSRLHDIPESPGRSPFQRDCDRIVHSTAFRRLMHKTQVFVAPDGDHFRTRLTHTIEVSRVARSLAAQLGLNADLADAIALAHDLGHPPFGHAGEDALAREMEAFGGFEHNAQAIRIVTRLERSYIGYDGLNLTFETLEGMAKHNGPVPGPVPFALAELDSTHHLDLRSQATAEAQAAGAADDIAYICHDLQDGIRARMFCLEDIGHLSIAGPAARRVSAGNPDAGHGRVVQTIVRDVFSELMQDVIGNSRRNLELLAPGSAVDIKRHEREVVGFSPAVAAAIVEIKGFLRDYMYRTGKVEHERRQGERIVSELFQRYLDDVEMLPGEWNRDAGLADDDMHRARVVADFVAGMTDKFAMAVHSDLCPATASP